MTAITVRAESGTWDFGGRIGAEVDGTHEEFGSGTLFDARLDPFAVPDDDGVLEDALLGSRFRSSSTVAGALGELTLTRDGARWMRGRGTIRAAKARTRGELDLAAGARGDDGRAQGGNLLQVQGGPEGGGAGFRDRVSAAGERGGLPADVRVRADVAFEISRAGDDSLRRLYDYHLVRPSVELRRVLGPGEALRLRGEVGRKWSTEGGSGSYSDRWGEVAWSRQTGRFDQIEIALRTGGRRYPDRASTIPAYEESSADGAASVPLGARFSLASGARVDRVSYAADDSLVFQDHWAGELTVSVESSWRRLMGRSPEGSLEEELGADWTGSLGMRVGALKNEASADLDRKEYALFANIGREPLTSLWFDLTAAWGRRTYRNDTAGGGWTLDTVDLSIVRTDHTFLSATFLGEAGLWGGVNLEIFGLLERERHADRADDYQLWLASVALVRRF